jgi:hypothetical protein
MTLSTIRFEEYSQIEKGLQTRKVTSSSSSFASPYLPLYPLSLPSLYPLSVLPLSLSMCETLRAFLRFYIYIFDFLLLLLLLLPPFWRVMLLREGKG